MIDSDIASDQVVLSESKDGRQIAISTTVTPGTLLHKGEESKSGEVWEVITIEAVDQDGATQTLTVAWGGLDASDLSDHALTAGGGRTPIIIKGRLRRGLEVRAWATAANKINVYGEVGILKDRETV